MAKIKRPYRNRKWKVVSTVWGDGQIYYEVYYRFWCVLFWQWNQIGGICSTEEEAWEAVHKWKNMTEETVYG